MRRALHPMTSPRTPRPAISGSVSSAVVSVLAPSWARTIIVASPIAGLRGQDARAPVISSTPKERPSATNRKSAGPINQQRRRFKPGPRSRAAR
jgi:hypothetical protein